jgi:hypothetical protein
MSESKGIDYKHKRRRKKSVVLAVLLGARALADNSYSWSGWKSARQNRQQIKPHWKEILP